MSESSSDSAPRTRAQASARKRWPSPLLFCSLLCPVIAAALVYHLDSFDPAPLPLHELPPRPVAAPRRNSHLLRGSELVGLGKLLAPEDIVFDAGSGVLYTGCADGWVKTVRVNDSAVEDWVNTGGRPLGLAIASRDQLVVADAEKGLLRVSQNGKVELLTDEAEGLRFKLTDGVAVAEDGTIYFTDASYKYRLSEFIFDVLEGKPHGRLLSYDPSTRETRVLLRHLYFPNGVVVSPDQSFVIFCETVMRRCKKYHIRGKKKGHVDAFIDHLPGMPDNIRYDDHGHYLIALASETGAWDLAFKYPFLRKCIAMAERYVGRPKMEKNSGVFEVDLEGKPFAHYYDYELMLISSGLKIRNHLYCGSVVYPYIIRLDLDQYPALESF